MKDSNRPRRVAELILRELATLVPRTLDDPLTHKATFTYAQMSRDLSSARVYFTVLGGAEEGKRVAQALNRAAGTLRHELKGRVVLRGIPQLRFYYDESVERGARLTSLIERAVAQDKEHAGE